MLRCRRLVVTLCIASASLAGLPSVATAQRAENEWTGCRDGLECTTVTVPVDYARPDGEQLDIAVARRPAERRRRIGSLVVNWGGPGDPGTETLRLLGDSFPPEIRARFDIVSFDPRGTGSSRPVDCVDDPTFERLINEDPTPDTAADLRRFYDGTNSAVDFVQACVDKYGPWLAGVGTRNVARDMDRIRAALGERRLSFLGYSYGTVIGAVYAQEFPDRVRAMVLDSAVNLSDSLASAQVGNLRGFEGALDEFLADCADNPECAFHSSGNPRAALARLRDRFESGLQLRTDDGRTAGQSSFYAALLGALYDRASGWPLLASALHEAVDGGSGTLLALIADIQAGRRDNGTYDGIRESIGFITCDDRPDPLAPFEEYQQRFDRFSREYPFFGPFVAAYPLGCDPRIPRPAPLDTVGDVRSTEAPPILVIGTTHDPATPYAGARDLQARLAGSRLLTFDSTEHGSYTKGVRCIDDAVDAYLLRRTLPPRGKRCHP